MIYWPIYIDIMIMVRVATLFVICSHGDDSMQDNLSVGGSLITCEHLLAFKGPNKQ